MLWQSAWSSLAHPGFGYTVAAFVFLAIVLLAGLPRTDRLHVLKVSALFGFSLGLLAVAGALLAFDSAPTAKAVRAVALLVEGLAFIRLAGLFLFKLLLPFVRLSPPQILQDVAIAMGSVVFMLIRLRFAGVDLAGIITTSAVLTAVIGLSLQDTLGNIIGGLALELDDSLEVGDWVKYDGVTGQVVSIGWRQTSIQTGNWETHVIPNNHLVKNKIVVLARRLGAPKYWRRWIGFNVDFRFAPTQVIETVENALRSCELPLVARDPKPTCVLMDFEESSCKYALRYHLMDPLHDDPTDSSVRTHIFFALKRAGISPSIPAQSVFVTEETPERKENKVERAVGVQLNALRRVEIFNACTPEELRVLASRLKPAPFAAGDVMTKQGATANWLYIVSSGHADVVIEADTGLKRKVAVIGPGMVFGEMGLMTGAKREATVIAATDVECYRLDKESFLDILRSRPAVAEDISHLLATRRTELEATRDNLSEEAKAQRLSSAQKDFLGRIRLFFDLR